MTQDFNYEEELKKLPTDKYLEMAILPLVHSVNLFLKQGLSVVDILRPQDPIAFLANFVLKNKHTMKKIETLIEFKKDTNILNQSHISKNQIDTNLQSEIK